LIYLLKIIQKQKELAEIKNDLISNITHEFKTPLATISVALEGIQRFNTNNDTEKSKKYTEMSKTEVDKLTFMVEKLLETATLDSDNLQLNLEETDLVSLIEKASTINSELTNGKEITFTSNEEEYLVNVDRFHFENALNNIIDNAIKYGGNKIEVRLEASNSEVNINIKDNGKELTKQQASKIFEKFYRVPKGNTHDVKGFGIGLYYSKNIIEKHGGSIDVSVGDGTEFSINIPLISKTPL
jgi:two-component system phosphate regulon sensor histidine kinase PhoR